MAAVRRRVHGRNGTTRTTFQNNIPELRRSLLSGIPVASRAGAIQAKKELERVFDEEGGILRWPENTRATRELKRAHGGILAPLRDTDALRSGIDIRDATGDEFEGFMGLASLVGWFEDQAHPESGLSLGELASLHEFGNPDNTFNGRAAPIPARPTVGNVTIDAQARFRIVAALEHPLRRRIEDFASPKVVT